MPDTWVTPRVWVAGEKVTASKKNDESNNFRVLWPYTAAGDVAYRDPAGAYLTRLAKPSVDSFFRNKASGVPDYLPVGAVPGLLHAQAAVAFDAGDQNTSSGSFVDVTNATLNITLTRTCSIYMFATCQLAVAVAGQGAKIRGVLGAVSASETQPYSSVVNYVPVPYFVYLANVAAATVTCKLQFATTGGTAIAGLGYIQLMAFVQ